MPVFASSDSSDCGSVRGWERNRSARAERNQKKEAKEHKKRNRVKARKNKRIFAFTWLAMVILVSLTLASYLIGGSNDFLGVDRTDSEVEVTIPENVTQEQLTDILYKSHAIDKPEFFSLFCKFTTEMEYFEPGTYTIKTNYDYKQLVNTLQSGPDLGEEVTVSFREGLLAFHHRGVGLFAKRLNHCGSNSGHSFSSYCLKKIVREYPFSNILKFCFCRIQLLQTLKK